MSEGDRSGQNKHQEDETWKSIDLAEQQKILSKYAQELKLLIAEGCQVIHRKDGTEERIGYEAMDPKTQELFLQCVDFTEYVNNGMEPALGDKVLDNVLAGKEFEHWLEGTQGIEGQNLLREYYNQEIEAPAFISTLDREIVR